MAPQVKLQLQQSRQLAMTPQLRQAIHMLQLSQQELNTLIEQSLQENPALEETDPLDELQSSAEEADHWDEAEVDLPDDPLQTLDTAWTDSASEQVSDWEVYAQASGEMSYSQVGTEQRLPRQSSDILPSLEGTLPATISMSEHLLWQAQITSFNDAEAEAARALIAQIDDNGYLQSSLEIILETQPHLRKILQKQVKKTRPSIINGALDKQVMVLLEDVLKRIHGFEPLGCGARSLEECLQIQLATYDAATTPLGQLSQQIIAKHLELLARQDLKKVAHLCKTSIEQVLAAQRLIASLEPKPGRIFHQQCAQTVVPDVYVIKMQGKPEERDDQVRDFRVVLNETGWSKLSVSPSYTLFCNKKAVPDLTAEYAQEKVRAAQNLIRSIEQRQKTLLKVTKSIIKHQYPFFEGGISHLRPMVLRDVAEDIDMHESTVSRIANGKYIQMAHGIKEIRFFFSSSVQQSGGHSISSQQIKQIIIEAIRAESPQRPLTDLDLVNHLQRFSRIRVSRRTVAKYREELNISSSNHRKKLF